MTDILVQARSNVQPAELEVLLYDIYVRMIRQRENFLEKICVFLGGE